MVLLLYGGHERIVFQPKKLAEDYQFEFNRPFVEVDLRSDTIGPKLHALHFPVPDTANGIVLYFHGNADNLQRWGQYTEDFTRHGYEVLAIDYPGYGKSGGTASEAALYESAARSFAWASVRFTPEQIIIYGRSLGSGPAAWLASRQDVQQLILETPFPSIPTLFRMRASRALVPFMPRVQFPVADYIRLLPYPVSIFQGTHDWVVPYRVASQLKPLLKSGDRWIVIEGGSHKNLRQYPYYQEQLAALLR